MPALAPLLIAACLVVTAGPLSALRPFGPGAGLDAAAARPQAYYLHGIEVTGLRRFSRVQFLAMSGLTLNTEVRVSDIAAARQRLVQTGFFTSVAYRFRQVRFSLTVVFTVEEEAWRTPAGFDNFVDHDAMQLVAAVARDVPTFDGTVPDQPIVLRRVARALERVARESNDAGTVDYVLVEGTAGRRAYYRFHLARASGPLPVCRLDLQAAAIPATTDAEYRLRSLLGSDYSADYVRRYAEENAIPVYRAHGYLDARVTEATGRREAARPECANGVLVTVRVDEGPAYSWNGAEWTGSQALAPAVLDRLLGMTIGDVADGPKIERGLAAVTTAYRQRGYLAVRLVASPALDPQAGRAAYRISVSEGAQYRMGGLTINGLTPGLEAQVRARWSLGEGDVFDATYPARFVRDTGDLARPVIGTGAEVRTRFEPDEATRTVHVTIDYLPKEGDGRPDCGGRAPPDSSSRTWHSPARGAGR